MQGNQCNKNNNNNYKKRNKNNKNDEEIIANLPQSQYDSVSYSTISCSLVVQGKAKFL